MGNWMRCFRKRLPRAQGMQQRIWGIRVRINDLGWDQLTFFQIQADLIDREGHCRHTIDAFVVFIPHRRQSRHHLSIKLYSCLIGITTSI